MGGRAVHRRGPSSLLLHRVRDVAGYATLIVFTHISFFLPLQKRRNSGASFPANDKSFTPAMVESSAVGHVGTTIHRHRSDGSSGVGSVKDGVKTGLLVGGGGNSSNSSSSSAGGVVIV